jgi:Ca2+-binding EF-hand superfamily protein
MHCIDCHTLGDVMGDGRLHGHMENSVEISCSACHGTFGEPSRLHTERGTPLKHLRREGERVFLRSKIDGREHLVPQAVHVLDAARSEFNAEAVKAMTEAHASLECYACHAGWNANFLGFHFSRQEQLTQLDLLSGRRTPGRVTTQEKVFATWKSFYAGRNERGAIAPYLTGFSSMGSVWDPDGGLILDQVLPVTAKGLSGMTMIHHQPHSIRPTARACVECHRTSATWGLGSANFRLARQLAFVADRRGIEVVAVDRSEFARSSVLVKFPLPDVVDLVAAVDPLQGHARHLFVAEGGRGIHVLDVGRPSEPRHVAFLATLDPRNIELAGDQLYVADGTGGLLILDMARPEAPRSLGRIPMFDAHDVEVRWPWAYVADGPAGLCVVDVSAPIAPRVLAECDLNGEARTANQAILVESLFQYSRPTARAGVPADERTRARNLCAVLDRQRGLYLVDVTEPTRPQVLYPAADERSRPLGQGNQAYRGLALRSQVDLADPQGGERTTERDYVYLLTERGQDDQRRSSLTLLDVTDPTRVLAREKERSRLAAGYTSEQLVLADYYDAPTRRRVAFSAGSIGVFVADVSLSKAPSQIGALPGLLEAYALCVEEFALDRMVSENGQPEKDVSHAGSRWLWRSEIERVLAVGAASLGTDRLYPDPGDTPGETARMHFAQADSDGSGWIDGAEIARDGTSSADLDDDGRVGLLELARASGSLGVLPEEPPQGAELGAARVLREGDLARLLDGVDPYRFDQDESGTLSRSEAERAFFSALDLDADNGLSLDELSRYPGELRALRYKDEGARKRFEREDKNRDGRVSAREFSLLEAEWHALDADRNGILSLLAPGIRAQRERGLVLPGSEWPRRRDELHLLPPGLKSEGLLAAFDRDGDHELDAQELSAREDLLAAFDSNGDLIVTREEVERRMARLEVQGVDALADDFQGRWDLDGSGAVDPDEVPAGVRLRLGLR